MFFSRKSESKVSENSERTTTTTTQTENHFNTPHFDMSTYLSPMTEPLKANRKEFTFSNVPNVLEAAFKYNEVILRHLPVPEKPLRQYETNEVIEWIKPIAPKELCDYIERKKINGELLRKFKMKKLMSHGCDETQSRKILKNIKEFDRESSFGLTVLKRQDDSYLLLREMYQFCNGFTNHDMLKLSNFEFRKGISLTFMAISYYFAENEPILTNDNLKEINERTKEINVFERIVCSTQNRIILNRTFSFVKTMIESPNSVFYYFKEQFIDYFINCLAPGLDPIPFRSLIDFTRNEITNNFVLESDETYAGEQIIGFFQDSWMLTYMLPLKERFPPFTKNDWEIGDLAITNYRLMWKPHEPTVFKMRKLSPVLYQIPIKCIRECVCAKEMEIGYSIRISAYTSQMLTFVVKTKTEVDEVERIIQEQGKRKCWVDEYDVYCKQSIIHNNSERLYSKIKDNENIELRKIGFDDEQYVFLKNKGNEGVVVIDESEKGGRIYRIDMKNTKMKEITELDGVDMIEFNYLNDKLLGEYMNGFYSFINSIKYNQLDEMYSKLEFITNIITKVMDCFNDIIPKFRQGRSFCFVETTSLKESCYASALFLIITDKHYRTFTGFLELIYTHFVCSKYFTIVGGYEYHPFNFCLFLHTVLCIMYSYPTIFQFNRTLIFFLNYHSFSNRFTTLSPNENPTQSLFLFLINNKEQFIKDDFEDFYFDVMDYWPQSIVLLQPYFFICFMNYTKDKQQILTNVNNDGINVSCRKLTCFPHYIYSEIEKERVKILNLSENGIEFIPTEIVDFPNLVELLIYENNIRYIPQWHLNHLTNLTKLDISEKPGFESQRYEMIMLDILSNLQYLNISNRIISSSMTFPPSIQTIIASNCFESLPTKMSELTKLVSLNLSNNPNINFNHVFQLNRLTSLNLSHCNKSNIPNSISSMTNLSSLILSFNRLEGLPLDLFFLTQLTNLDLSHNDLRYLSQLCSQLVGLQQLDVSFNPNITSPIELHQIKISIPIQKPLFETPLHILSDSKGIVSFKSYYVKSKNSKYSNIWLYEQLPINDEPKSHHFLLQYHDFSSRIGFIPPVSDCYVIVLMFDTWRTVLAHWKYYLQRSFPNDGSFKMRVMFFLENQRTTEDQSAIESIKKKLSPWNSDVTTIILKSKKKLDIESKLKKLISDFKDITSTYNESLLKLAKEIRMATFDPPILKEGQLIPIMKKFGVKEQTHDIIDCLHQLGVVISVSRSNDHKTENKMAFNNLLTLTSTNSNLVIVDLNIFGRIYHYLEHEAKDGFGFVDSITDVIQSYRGMGPDTIDILLYFIQILYDVFIIRDIFLSKFNLDSQYIQFVSTFRNEKTNNPSSLPTTPSSKPESRIERIQRSLSTAPQSHSPNQNIFHPTSRTPAVSSAQTTQPTKILYFQSSLLPQASLDVNDIWPKNHDSQELDFGRIINFQYLPPIFFSTFILFVSIKGLTIHKVLRDLCVLKKVVNEQHIYFFVGSTEKQLTIRIRFRANNSIIVFAAADLMGLLMDSFYEIHKTLFPSLQYDEFVLCPKCLFFDQKNPSAIPLKEFNESISKNRRIISFGQCHSCALGTCGLDLILKGLNNKQTNIPFDEIDKDSLTQDNLLGIGSTAHVYSIVYRNKRVALKLFSFQASNFSLERGEGGAAHFFSERITELKREMHVMSTIESPYILKLFGFSFEPLALIMDICDMNDLYTYINKKENELSWPMIIKFAMQIATGMASLHEASILHRDLKSPNILLKTEEDGLKCVISDFGLSGTFNEEDTSLVDNPLWVAPEVMGSKPFTKEADVYGFAIILWELLARERPFESFKIKASVHLQQLVVSGTRPDIPSSPYPKYGELIQICWSPNPSERLSFIEIIRRLQTIRTLVEGDFQELSH